jgi:hypothetical protein
MNPYEPPNSEPPAIPFWSSLFRRKPTHYAEPQRLLDDVAQAIHQTRAYLIRADQKGFAIIKPRVKRRIVRSLLLKDQFELVYCDRYWRHLWKNLSCPLPSFPCDDSSHRFASSFSIQDVVDHVVDVGLLGNRVATGGVTVQQWVNAQVFAGVQQVTIDACGVDREEVFRSAHFVNDLGC